MDQEAENKELRSIIANLESKVDILESELEQLNDMLMRFGFTQGIESLTRSINEIMRNEDSSSDDNDLII